MDQIKIEITEDGTIKFSTDSISQANHVAADEFLETIQNMMGGETKSKQKPNKFWANRAVKRGGKIVTKGN